MLHIFSVIQIAVATDDDAITLFHLIDACAVVVVVVYSALATYLFKCKRTHD